MHSLYIHTIKFIFVRVTNPSFRAPRSQPTNLKKIPNVRRTSVRDIHARRGPVSTRACLVEEKKIRPAPMEPLFELCASDINALLPYMKTRLMSGNAQVREKPADLAIVHAFSRAARSRIRAIDRKFSNYERDRTSGEKKVYFIHAPLHIHTNYIYGDV